MKKLRLAVSLSFLVLIAGVTLYLAVVSPEARGFAAIAFLGLAAGHRMID